MAKLNLDLLKHNNLDFSVGIDANGNTTYSLHGQVDLPIPGFKSAGSVSIHFTQDQYQQLKAAGGDFNAVKGLGPFSLSLDGGGNCAIDPQQAFSCSLDVTASGSLGFESDFASAGLSQNLAHCSVQISARTPETNSSETSMQDFIESLDVSATCSSPLLPSQQGIQHLENRINDIDAARFSQEKQHPHFSLLVQRKVGKRNDPLLYAASVACLLRLAFGELASLHSPQTALGLKRYAAQPTLRRYQKGMAPTPAQALAA